MIKRTVESALNLCLTLGVILVTTVPVMAGTSGTNPGQFGLQGRANAVSKMIVLGVQQGISSLPPTSGQAFSYRFDPELSTYVASELLGPTSFRSTQLVGKGNFSLRFSTSYFELSDDFGPKSYFIEPEDPNNTTFPSGYARFGVDASAKVLLFNTALTYGVMERLELMLNVPISRVDATASQSFTSRAVLFDLPPNQAIVSGAATEEDLDVLLELPLENEDGTPNPAAIRYRDERFTSLGANFNEGDSAGFGRVSIGARVLALDTEYVSLSFQPELFLPSPNEDEYAGSNSWAVLPRVVVQATPLEHFWIHADAGYDYDFDTSELRRFVWNIGGSVPFNRFSFDAGVGGSLFDSEIEWTPKTIRGAQTGGFPATVGTRQGGAGIGNNFVDFLGGFKVRVFSKTVLGGGVNVPVNGDGFRADAVGTVAVEQYF